MLNRLNIFFFVSSFVVAVSGSVSASASVYKARVEVTGKLGYSSKPGAKRNTARVGLILPVFQRANTLTFLSAIGFHDTTKHLEGNVGIGHRFLFNQAWILGGYGFYDLRKTENNNLLQQLTFGVEAISKNLEFRTNLYIPVGKKSYELSNHNIGDIKYSPNLGHTKFSFYHKKKIEKALTGFDVEVGGSLPRFSRVEAFVAYYHFDAKGVDTIDGVRIRGSLHATNWLSIEGEVNCDTVRRLTSYAGLKVALNIGAGKTKNSDWIGRKMTMLPVRDVDIVHGIETQKSQNHYKIFQGRVAAAFAGGTFNSDDIIHAKNVPILFNKDMSNLMHDAESIGDAVFNQHGVDDIVVIGLENQANSITLESLRSALYKKRAATRAEARRNLEAILRQDQEDRRMAEDLVRQYNAERLQQEERDRVYAQQLQRRFNQEFPGVDVEEDALEVAPEQVPTAASAPAVPVDQEPELAPRFRVNVDAILGEYGLMDDAFDSLSHADKTRVLGIFISRDFSPENLNFMKGKDIDYENVLAIYRHPCPQNRSTGTAYLNIGNSDGDGPMTTTGVRTENDGVTYVYAEPFGHTGGIVKEPQGILGLTALGTDQDKLSQIHRCHDIQYPDYNVDGRSYRMDNLRSDPGYPGLTGDIVRDYMTSVFRRTLHDL